MTSEHYSPWKSGCWEYRLTTSPHDNGRPERNLVPLAWAPIPIRAVGSAVVRVVWGMIEEFEMCVCVHVCVRVCVRACMFKAGQHLVLNSLSGSLCLACYRQPPSSCPGDGWALVWMFHCSLGGHPTFPALSPSLCLCQVGTEFTQSPVWLLY